MPRLAQTGLELPLALSTRALWLALAVLLITDLRALLGALDSQQDSAPSTLTVWRASTAGHQAHAASADSKTS